MFSNVSLFHLINDLAGRWAWLDFVGRFCSQYLWLLMVAVLLGLVMFRRRRFKDMAIVALGAAVVGRLGFVTIIKWLYDHPRPDKVIEIHALLAGGDTVNSFPSGHMTFCMALATGVYLYNKKLGYWFFAAALLVGVARVFVGVHWPYDIIAGAILGAVVAYACRWFYRILKLSRTIV